MNATLELNKTAGLMAEEQVADKYRRCGFKILDQQYRCLGGEIDVIAGHGKRLYFIEVKKAKTHNAALARISPKKLQCLQRAAYAYVMSRDDDVACVIRFDAALVDAQGKIKVITNITI